jgi:hypothetical protein
MEQLLSQDPIYGDDYIHEIALKIYLDGIHARLLKENFFSGFSNVFLSRNYLNFNEIEEERSLAG